MERLWIGAGNEPGPAERRLGLWVSSFGHGRDREHVVHDRTREDWLVMYVVAGHGTLRNGAHRLNVPAGAAVACFPHIAHDYRSDPEAGWEIWWCHFDGPQAARLVELCGLRPDQAMILPGVDQGLVGQWADALAALDRHGPHAGLDAGARLWRILVDTACRSQLAGHDQHRLLAAVEGEPRDLETMARAAGMGRFAFCRAFTAALGISPWRYVTLRRIARAKQLLAGSDLPVKEVATACGFDDPDYFSRAFRRETGTTPGAWRAAGW